jgi:hypothetical protein
VHRRDITHATAGIGSRTTAQHLETTVTTYDDGRHCPPYGECPLCSQERAEVRRQISRGERPARPHDSPPATWLWRSVTEDSVEDDLQLLEDGLATPAELLSECLDWVDTDEPGAVALAASARAYVLWLCSRGVATDERAL